jgi:hypothetical protein
VCAVRPLLARGFRLRFLSDYFKLILQYSANLTSLADGWAPPGYRHRQFCPHIEQLVCAHARAFYGTPTSTFSGYAVRLRGYLSEQPDSRLALGEPLEPTRWLPAKGASDPTELERSWPRPAWWANEWPLAWTNIDAGEAEPEQTWHTDNETASRLERMRPLALACLQRGLGFAINTEKCFAADGLHFLFGTADDGRVLVGTNRSLPEH